MCARCHVVDVNLPVSTEEKFDYAEHWSSNASHFDHQGCYDWMAAQLSPLRPNRIFDVGCGTGEGLRALLRAFSPTIIAIDENAECIIRAEEALRSEASSIQSMFRLGYREFADGSHDIAFDQSTIVPAEQVTLIHADILVDDPEFLRFLAAEQKFDAVTVWLTGTFMYRRTCRNIANLKIADPDTYRLRVQNRIYKLAADVLRPGGWLQVVDRGEPPSEQFLLDDVFKSHREQAGPTDLEVSSVQHRAYTESSAGIRMVASTPTSGRQPTLTKLALVSVLSRKPG
ncbi:MAG: hypothetical protein QOH88_1784 [Verrucomicrobiota bacterium]|jgi:SAM-dependent methyltransferase